MKRLPISIIVQAVTIPFIITGVVVTLLTMDGQSESAKYIVVMLLAYLMGSISWGYMVLQWKMGVDVRELSLIHI